MSPCVGIIPLQQARKSERGCPVAAGIPVLVVPRGVTSNYRVVFSRRGDDGIWTSGCCHQTSMAPLLSTELLLTLNERCPCRASQLRQLITLYNVWFPELRICIALLTG